MLKINLPRPHVAQVKRVSVRGLIAHSELRSVSHRHRSSPKISKAIYFSGRLLLSLPLRICVSLLSCRCHRQNRARHLTLSALFSQWCQNPFFGHIFPLQARAPKWGLCRAIRIANQMGQTRNSWHFFADFYRFSFAAVSFSVLVVK